MITVSPERIACLGFKNDDGSVEIRAFLDSASAEDFFDALTPMPDGSPRQLFLRHYDRDDRSWPEPSARIQMETAQIARRALRRAQRLLRQTDHDVVLALRGRHRSTRKT